MLYCDKKIYNLYHLDANISLEMFRLLLVVLGLLQAAARRKRQSLEKIPTIHFGNDTQHTEASRKLGLFPIGSRDISLVNNKSKNSLTPSSERKSDSRNRKGILDTCNRRGLVVIVVVAPVAVAVEFPVPDPLFKRKVVFIRVVCKDCCV